MVSDQAGSCGVSSELGWRAGPRTGGPRARRCRSQGGSQRFMQRKIFSMTSSCAGDEMAAMTFMVLPQRGQRVGSSSQTRLMRRARGRDQGGSVHRRLRRTNSLSSSWVTATEGALGAPDAEPPGVLIQPKRLRSVVEAAP